VGDPAGSNATAGLALRVTGTHKPLHRDKVEIPSGRTGCICEIKCRIAMAKSAFNKKRTLFTSTLNLELRKKLVKCYVWSIALYSAETWTLRAVDQKRLESFEIWCWRRMEKIC
jgi:hypothetical protein